MKKKIKKIKLSTLRNRADKLFSQYIRNRDKVCQFKGADSITCNNKLQAMHLMSRRNMRLRYDELNCMAGCSAHHAYYSYRVEEWVFFLYENFPYYFHYILNTRHEIVKANEEYFRKVIEEYAI